MDQQLCDVVSEIMNIAVAHVVRLAFGTNTLPWRPTSPLLYDFTVAMITALIVTSIMLFATALAAVCIGFWRRRRS